MGGDVTTADLTEEVRELYFSLILNFAILLAAIMLFVVLRVIRLSPYWLNFRRIYAPRTFSHLYTAPKFNGWLTWTYTWVLETLSYSHPKMLKSHGADSAIYTRFLFIGIIFSFSSSIVGLVILLPFYVFGDKNLGGLQQFTVNNLKDSNVAVVPALATIFLSIIAYICLAYMYVTYARIRSRWFRGATARSFTVMVEEVPEWVKEENDLKSWFQYNFPYDVINVSFSYSSFKMSRLIANYSKAIDNYEHALECMYKKEKIPKKYLWSWWKRCICYKVGPSTNAVEYYQTLIKKYEEKIQLKQAFPNAYMGFNKVAFVTFNSIFPARAKVYPFEDPRRMIVSPAPDPGDIAWKQLGVSLNSQLLRAVMLSAIFLVIILFWVFPSTFVLEVGKVQFWGGKNDTVLPTDHIVPRSVSLALLRLIPILILVVMTGAFGPAMRFIVNRFMGFHKKSTVARYVLVFYFGYLFLNVFVVGTISDTIIDLVELLQKEGSEVAKTLGSNVPLRSSFYANYILILALGRLILKLFRLSDLLSHVLSMLRAKTYRQKETALQPRQNYIEIEQSTDLLIFLILFVYSSMAPLVSIFALIYFSLAYFVHKYNLLYCQGKVWQSGGEMWPIIFHILSFSLVIGQIIMASLITIKSPNGSGTYMYGLPIITGIFWYVTHTYYRGVSIYGTVNNANSVPVPSLEEVIHAYRDPHTLPRDYFMMSDSYHKAVKSAFEGPAFDWRNRQLNRSVKMVELHELEILRISRRQKRLQKWRETFSDPYAYLDEGSVGNESDEESTPLETEEEEKKDGMLIGGLKSVLPIEHVPGFNSGLTTANKGIKQTRNAIFGGSEVDSDDDNQWEAGAAPDLLEKRRETLLKRQRTGMLTRNREMRKRSMGMGGESWSEMSMETSYELGRRARLRKATHGIYRGASPTSPRVSFRSPPPSTSAASPRTKYRAMTGNTPSSLKQCFSPDQVRRTRPENSVRQRPATTYTTGQGNRAPPVITTHPPVEDDDL